MHIAVAGNIGSGKTTLTSLLARHYHWEPHYERVEENPYLHDFYDDMQKWAFNLQVYLLTRRFQHLLGIANTKQVVIQDRTIYEDVAIFAPNLFDMGLMSKRDFDTYLRLFEQIASVISMPHLTIYLRASVPTLVSQIQKRGRKFETSIRIDYLHRLNERYEAWIEKYQGRLLIVDVDQCQFSERSEDLRQIINKIDAELHGLF
ncbi:MAG: deoxynucleoside kinase [Bacteroidales bacterium]